MQEAVVYVDNCTQINNIKALEFSISPNPNNGTFDIMVPQAISNATGRNFRLKRKSNLMRKTEQKKQRINLNNISRGYILSH